MASTPDLAEIYQLDMWLNPHGFLKAARLPGANPRATWRWELGEMGRDGPEVKPERVTVVSITVNGKFRVDATINKENLLQRIHTWVADPVLGDMNYEHEFTNASYVDLGNGIRFPTEWHSHQGWDDNYGSAGGERGPQRVRREAEGHQAEPVSRHRRRARAGAPGDVPGSRRDQQAGRGVYLLGGGTHNSMAVEFRDFIAVFEAPLNEERSLAVIEEIVKLIPGKPIRWLINSHQHFDHAGGLRAYMHIGATIVTHVKNFDFYVRDVLNYAPRTMKPDMVSLWPPTELAEGYFYEAIRENFIISDGTRNLNVHYVNPLQHVEGMLIAYLPRERLLFEADLHRYGSAAPATPTSRSAQLLQRGPEAGAGPLAGRAGARPPRALGERPVNPRPPLSRASSELRRASVDALRRDLESAIEGEVRFDPISRALYSTDASVYQIQPLGVVVVKSRDDVVRTVTICAQAPLPADDEGRRHVAGRSGHRQRRHRRHVEVLQPAARSESGGALGARRAGHRARRAERGAASARSALRAGHLDGQPRHRRRHDGQQLGRRAIGALREDHRPRARAARRAVGRIARAFPAARRGPSSTTCARATRSKARAIARCGGPSASTPTEIERRYPKVLRRVGGYNLDALVAPAPDGAAPFNMAKLMVGSEGTLGVVVEAKIALVPLPKFKAVLAIQFADLLEALEATPAILAHRPSAIEVMDRFILDHTQAERRRSSG